jgi:hypothetical protein
MNRGFGLVLGFCFSLASAGTGLTTVPGLEGDGPVVDRKIVEFFRKHLLP